MDRPSASDDIGAPRRWMWSGSLVDLGIAALLWAAAVVASVQTMGLVGSHGAGSHHIHGPRGVLPPASAVGAWAVMSLAMMLPTAVPMLRALADVLAARTQGQATRRRRVAPSPEWWAFLVAYAAVWAAVSAGFAVVQALLGASGLAGQGESTGARLVVAAALAAAGAYQFTSLKAQCLTGCSRPITFLMSSWRPGAGGAWRMGLSHAATCVGCCWALMALALAGGVHSVPFMAVATVVMVIEKLPSVGERVRVPLGILLVGSGAGAALLALA